MDSSEAFVTTGIHSDSLICCFEDNFTPPTSYYVPPTGLTEQFTKLPDSDQYLATLENKLKKLQQSSSKKENIGKDILKSLGESRQSCMLNFLTSENTVTAEEPTFQEFKINPILSKINPEKQALGADELIQLVKADQLAQESAEGQEEQELHKENSN